MIAPVNMSGMTHESFWGLVALEELTQADRWRRKARETSSTVLRRSQLVWARRLVRSAGEHLTIAGLR